jgi:plastocyanin
MRAMKLTLLGVCVIVVLSASLPANAIHWYRGTTAGCSEADGALTDDPQGTEQNVAATVVVGHNTFSEGISGFSTSGPVETHIDVGESITWTWNSAHCHSVTSEALVPDTTTPVFDSGFHYPKTPPESAQVVPGAFEYPMLDETPTMSYTRTFPTAGTYAYYCVHHASIGMNGVVVVH